LLVVIVTAAALGGGWLWLRGSSLVAVRTVTITGVSGRDAAAIRAALTAAARRMTTLDLQESRLRAAVAAYPEVVGLRVNSEFPHGVRIVVLERVPIAVLSAAGRKVVVDSDGQLLPGWSARGLPQIPLPALPRGRRATAGRGLAEVQLLAAAPWQLIDQIAQVTKRPGRGLVVWFRHGPLAYFGAADQAAAKWAALVAVLASPGAAEAGYIDVADPQHPAAGGGSLPGVRASAGTATASAGPSTATMPAPPPANGATSTAAAPAPPAG
jgi:cell division protein FtsQ